LFGLAAWRRQVIAIPAVNQVGSNPIKIGRLRIVRMHYGAAGLRRMTESSMASRVIEGLLAQYETGRLSRRDLVLALAALAAAPSTGVGVNLAVGDSFLGIYQAGANAMPHINHFCFGLEGFDADGTVAALEKSGMPAESRARDGVPQVYTADPDNLRVQLQDVSFCGGLGPLGNECR
jgi:hypothetical protein